MDVEPSQEEAQTGGQEVLHRLAAYLGVPLDSERVLAAVEELISRNEANKVRF